jgi:uncharacterized phage protein gp47/JayE
MSSIYPDDTDTTFAGVVGRVLGFAGRSNDTVGGVARTLIEAFAREMALFYATLESAHRAGFLDTAEGPSLDLVVSILGLERRRAGRLSGRVEFSRGSPALQDIVVPAGRRVTGVVGDKPLPLFETVEEVTISRGETRAVAEVQEVPDAHNPAPPLLNPGVLTIMPRPVLGVEQVTNIEPIRQLQADETDDRLRARARTVLRESQRGTLDAIAAAIREQGITTVDVREADDSPGVLDVVLSDQDLGRADVTARVDAAIRATKPAGIRVRIATQHTLRFSYTADVELADPRLDDRARARLADALADAVVQAARGLVPGATIRKQKLDGLLLADHAVASVHSSGLAAQPNFHTASKPDEARILKPTGDLYVYPDEAVVLDRKDVTITWFVRPSLAIELVVDKAGTADATRAAAREAVDQLNAFIRAGGQPGLLFTSIKDRLTVASITLIAVSFTRDGVLTTERENGPKAATLQADEILVLDNVEVVA